MSDGATPTQIPAPLLPNDSSTLRVTFWEEEAWPQQWCTLCFPLLLQLRASSSTTTTYLPSRFRYRQTLLPRALRKPLGSKLKWITSFASLLLYEISAPTLCVVSNSGTFRINENASLYLVSPFPRMSLFLSFLFVVFSVKERLAH